MCNLGTPWCSLKINHHNKLLGSVYNIYKYICYIYFCLYKFHPKCLCAYFLDDIYKIFSKIHTWSCNSHVRGHAHSWFNIIKLVSKIVTSISTSNNSGWEFLYLLILVNTCHCPPIQYEMKFTVISICISLTSNETNHLSICQVKIIL